MFVTNADLSSVNWVIYQVNIRARWGRERARAEEVGQELNLISAMNLNLLGSKDSAK